ncbi:MAG: FG-GAP-like repeat-containing protein, partial [Verrucomicrobiota bacterium]
MKRLIKDKRLVLTFLIIALIGFKFWTGSRYPELGAKASMGMISDIQSLGLDAKWEQMPGDPFWVRVPKFTINWIFANKRGMMFGLLFAAGLMTALSRIGQIRLRGGFSNTLAGAMIGAPLGVCVNCATPIMRGMHEKGMRLEMSLGAMFSSPTFNVIVVSMLFSLFPWQLAALKIGFSLLLVLALVPALVHYARLQGWVTKDDCLPLDAAKCDVPDEIDPDAKNWLSALKMTTQDYGKNLWVICYKTVPLMILAGFLGAILLETFSLENLAKTSEDLTFLQTLGIMAGVALVGALLPVPMAIDVMLAATLYAAGVPAHFAMALLFTAGIYSVYSLSVIGKSISAKLGWLFFGAVVLLGVLSGYTARYGEKWHMELVQKHFVSSLAQSPPSEPPVFPPLAQGTKGEAVLASLESNRLPFAKEAEGANITIQSRPYPTQPEPAADGEPAFVRHLGRDLGIDVPYHNHTDKIASFLGTFSRSIASGDVHGDGWPDVVTCGDFMSGGLALFANVGGERFEQQALDLGELESAKVVLTALVDLNNDGWLDVFFSTFEQGIYVIYNKDGQFDGSLPQKLYHAPGASAVAAGFADLNGDSQLEIVVGSWVQSWAIARIEGAWQASRNQILWSQADGSYDAKPLPGEPGETLSILLSDYNVDGKMDLIVGNDFDEPDIFYLGQKDNELRQVTVMDRIIPMTTYFTMGAETADLNNDLSPEILMVGIATGGVSRRTSQSISANDVRTTLTDPKQVEDYDDFITKVGHIVAAWRNPQYMTAEHDLRDQQNGIACSIFQNSFSRGRQKWLEYIPEHREDLQAVVSKLRQPLYKPTLQEAAGEIPQIQLRNVLLSKSRDVTRQFGLEFTGWTWNAKFADLNNDSWQDIYFLNGYIPDPRRESN